MDVNNLVICDWEEGYAKALALYLMRKKELTFQVQVCSSMEHVLAAAESGIDLLFISERFSLKERRKINAKYIFVLSAGKLKTKDERELVIFKYQSGEKILSEVFQKCESLAGTNELFQSGIKRKSGKIIGVFSPVHRIGKTSYALKLSERISSTSNALYLNLEIFGGIGGHFEEGGQTLADVLYYARQEKGNLGWVLTTIVRHREGFDYVLPMPVSEDMKEVQADEWVQLVKKILSESIYETIILDLDEGIGKVYDILKICTEIHLLTDESQYSKAKIRQFEKELMLLGHEDILRKIIRKERRSC